jgi:RNA polymerase sigma-70 factor (ECF subfamily)
LGRDFRPWILTIAVNLARDRWRRRSSAPATVSLANESGDPIPLLSPEPSAESAAVGEELRERAEAAFQRLDPEARTVLWLRVREGLDYREMAQVLGIPRGTVMSRLSRARQALRAELERGSGDRSRS